MTASTPAQQFMLDLLAIAALNLARLDDLADMKAIYRIEGKMRAMVSMARLAAVAQKITDVQAAAPAASAEAEDDVAPAYAHPGLTPREALERRLVVFEAEIERKRAEILAREGPSALDAEPDDEDFTEPGRSFLPP